MAANELTPQQQSILDARFAMWRFHMWHKEQGSYNTIEAKVLSGELRPYFCPDETCDCNWVTQRKESGVSNGK